MNRKELSAQLAEKMGLPHSKIDQIMVAMIDEIQAQLARGESVKLQGLGTFEIRARAPRRARNLVSGGFVEVPAQLVPGFKPSRLLKDLVNED